MYKKTEIEIKRTAVINKENDVTEMEVATKMRGKLTSEQIEEAAKITERALEQIVAVAEKDGDC